MILAAGLGTRLLPLTKHTPKALVEIGETTLLERTMGRLVDAGCDRIVVNLHHHAERISDFLAHHCAAGGQTTGDLGSPYVWSGAEVLLSIEPDGALETGGGLKRARHLFRGDRTILLHNVDVLSTIDLAVLAREHEASGALATLAVNRRPASRHLVFDESGLCGRIDTRSGSEEWARAPSSRQWRAGFTGIHALSPGILGRLTEEGAFSIVRAYLRLAASGACIEPCDVTGDRWLDVGTHERLDIARREWVGTA
jgi:NDP-sugar pyrophosphorylase family protein